MLIVTRYGHANICSDVLARLSELTGVKQNDSLMVIASQTIERLVKMTESELPPLMQDADVFLAQVLLEDPGDVQVKPDLLEAMLEAWKAAEGSLKKEARVAMRLLDKVMQEVMASPNRQAFIAWFQSATLRMTDGQGMYMRMYLERLIEWESAGDADIGAEPHYIARVLKGVFERHLISDVAVKKGRAFCKRRLQVAKSTLDDHFFA